MPGLHHHDLPSIMNYQPAEDRYDKIGYNFCGQSGVQIARLAFGFWHNFGGGDDFENGRRMVRLAFDHGINHFDLANNYGPPPGSAEENFGRILRKDFRSFRDEMFISTKAGYRMWDGPFGDGGSRKYLLSSLDQSLSRMGLDYVDIFYHHRADFKTPLEETMQALVDCVHQGKALYVGLSNYPAVRAVEAFQILAEAKVPCLLYQGCYNLLHRACETNGVFDVTRRHGVGFIAFSPLAQGLLSSKYLHGIPGDSRAARPTGFLRPEQISEEILEKVRALHEIARKRGQSLAQMALAWASSRPNVTSVLAGFSKTDHVLDNIQGVSNHAFSTEELARIDAVLTSQNSTS